MQTMTFRYDATQPIARRAHVGVVGSGDLEILLQPSEEPFAEVIVRTRFDGYETLWTSLLERFFAEHPIAARIEMNDFGATPGMVSMRLMQALEGCGSEQDG